MTSKIFKKGFIATTAIILLVTGTLAFLVTTMIASVSYADTVGRREFRIQKKLNELSCELVIPLLLAKDHFLAQSEREVVLADFDCVLNI